MGRNNIVFRPISNIEKISNNYFILKILIMTYINFKETISVLFYIYFFTFNFVLNFKISKMAKKERKSIWQKITMKL